MRIVILGAGAVGGYYGGRLVEAGADVTFVVREARKAQLDLHGLIVESPLGSLRRPVRAVTSAELVAGDLGSGFVSRPADLVVLTPKAYDLDVALDAVAPAVGPGTAVLPLLNGVAHLDRIAARFPVARAWGGVAHIGATLTEAGTIRHLNSFNRILFGARGAMPDPRAAALADLFALTPVEAEARPAIEQDLWDKLVFLATLAGSTCLFRASIGVIRETPAGRQAIADLLAESVAIATREGFAPSAQALDGYRVELDRAGSPSTSSMLRDIERGAQTERAHILGDLLVRAARHELAVPMLALADAHVAAYEARRVM
jgi:2-dehydropantoate 2-reductase